MDDSQPINPFEHMIPQEGHLISFEFTLRFEGGEVIDSNVGMEPMSFQSGVGEMLPALEDELIQLNVGESKTVILPSEQAYGPTLEEAYREFPLEAMPEAARQVGRKVMSRAPDGSEEMVEIVDIRGDKAVLDFNHPLAGKTLHFDVKVLANEQLGVDPFV
jgi:FKBP-type peptidyl-prolyl cis-trans isomerase 2